VTCNSISSKNQKKLQLHSSVFIDKSGHNGSSGCNLLQQSSGAVLLSTSLGSCCVLSREVIRYDTSGPSRLKVLVRRAFTAV
jgi:hypothetical protein